MQKKPAKLKSSNTLRIVSFSYSEFLGDPRQWILEQFELESSNLLVGENSAGKSRIVNVIHGLTRLLNGEVPKVFESGHYRVTLSSELVTYDYELFIRDSAVVKEVLTQNDITLLDRGENGIGTIWAEKIQLHIDFEAPPDQIAAKSRRDSIQHPFFEDIHSWADSTRFFPFGSALGRHELTSFTPAVAKPNDLSFEIPQAERVSQIYTRAFQEFGSRFDKAILRDLETLGYSCSAVGAKAEFFHGLESPVVLLFLKEKDIKATVTQLIMSQGMYRALSLVIHLNFFIFRGIPRLLLIDDIGEGLDFARSKSFIDMLIERASKHKIQLVMTTNDRFVMNGVDLRYWGIVERKASRVNVINRIKEPKVFSEFSELGLNNFDFFAGKYYEGLPDFSKE